MNPEAHKDILDFLYKYPRMRAIGYISISDIPPGRNSLILYGIDGYYALSKKTLKEDFLRLTDGKAVVMSASEGQFYCTFLSDDPCSHNVMSRDLFFDL